MGYTGYLSQNIVISFSTGDIFVQTKYLEGSKNDDTLIGGPDTTELYGNTGNDFFETSNPS
jgi:hypothetical protein